MTPPVASVIIPSHRSGYLAEAMSSVFDQTFTDYQLIVGYDRAWYADKFNNLVRAARGEYVVILADDDRLHPHFLEQTILTIREGPYDLVYTDARCFGAAGGTYRALPWSIETFKTTTAPWLSTLVRRSVWERLGGMDCALDYHDWDFWYRCFKDGATAAHLAATLFECRQHERQMTHGVDRSRAVEQIYAKHPELRPNPIESLDDMRRLLDQPGSR